MDFKLFVLNACVLLWILRVQCISSANCSTVFQGLPTFQNCSYRCHCKNDTQCDEQTGSCGNDGCEFGWMGPGCQYRNIAQFYTRAQTVGGTINSTDWATNAVDGDVTTCARTSTAGADSNYQSYWRIDWDKYYRIVGLVIKVRQDETYDFNRFRVETGTGINDDDFNNICYEHDDIPGTQEMEIMCRQPVWTKHLRIILDKRYTRLRVCEVEIYGGRDLTFNRPTSQSSTYTDPHTNWAWVSSRAVDGRAHTSDINAGDTCSATNDEIRPYWNVDFLTEYVVESIYFYGMLQTYEQYKYFKLSLIKAGGTDTVLLYEEPGNTDDRSYQPKIVDLTTIVTGRYLEVDRQLSDIAFLTICEIIVFGECPPGKCGWDCNIDCHCAAEITGTFQKDGICPNGCSGRWTGVNKTCTLECTSTQWGNQCQYDCGHCLQEEPCNVVTGHCENGCSGPFYPPLCTQGVNVLHNLRDNITMTMSSVYNGMVPDYATNHWYGTRDPETCKCCSITTNEQISWWKVDLQNIYPLKEMHVYASENDRSSIQLNGFSVYLANDSKEEAKLVFSDTSNINEDNDHFVIQLSNRLGRIVTIQRFGTLAVCNVSLIQGECVAGYFGPHCADLCHCADGASCNINNGNCQSPVCKLGWTGPACNTECPIHRFGEGCKNECFCKEGTCTKDYGICNGVCQAGYRGAQCNEACPFGTFGESCTEMCHCQNSTCSADDGLCPGDCIDGYEGQKCNKKSIGKDNTIAIGIGVGVGAFVLIVILIVVIYRYRIYKREHYIKENYASTDNRNAPPEEQVYDSIDTDIGTNEARLGETNM